MLASLAQEPVGPPELATVAMAKSVPRLPPLVGQGPPAPVLVAAALVPALAPALASLALDPPTPRSRRTTRLEPCARPLPATARSVAAGLVLRPVLASLAQEPVGPPELATVAMAKSVPRRPPLVGQGPPAPVLVVAALVPSLALAAAREALAALALVGALVPALALAAARATSTTRAAAARTSRAAARGRMPLPGKPLAWGPARRAAAWPRAGAPAAAPGPLRRAAAWPRAGAPERPGPGQPREAEQQASLALDPPTPRSRRMTRLEPCVTLQSTTARSVAAGPVLRPVLATGDQAVWQPQLATVAIAKSVPGLPPLVGGQGPPAPALVAAAALTSALAALAPPFPTPRSLRRSHRSTHGPADSSRLSRSAHGLAPPQLGTTAP